MAEFKYNNSKIASIDYTLFDLNCSYQLHFSLKKTTISTPNPK